MSQYIDKAVIKAELERLISIANSQYDLVGNEDIRNRILWSQQASVCSQILAFLDTLEVDEEPLSEDLEEAASQYPSVICQISPQWKSEVENVFKAGAEWQKEQMMEGTINGTARPLDDEIWCNGDEIPKNIQDGDKVKVLIIKEE